MKDDKKALLVENLANSLSRVVDDGVVNRILDHFAKIDVKLSTSVKNALISIKSGRHKTVRCFYFRLFVVAYAFPLSHRRASVSGRKPTCVRCRSVALTLSRRNRNRMLDSARRALSVKLALIRERSTAKCRDLSETV